MEEFSMIGSEIGVGNKWLYWLYMISNYLMKNGIFLYLKKKKKK
mgnify:CR=1 FL=1